jgi:hypothetical protein
MVDQWGDEKGKLESQIQKMSEQLENIKGRANRQSKSSREKLNLLANDRQRSTVGDYKLETIQEIHDEIADVERLSNFISQDGDDHSVEHDISRKESMENKSGKKSGYHFPSKFHELSIISPKNLFKDDRHLKDSENVTIQAVFRAVSEPGHFERNKITDDTLHRRLILTSGATVPLLSCRKLPCGSPDAKPGTAAVLLHDSDQAEEHRAERQHVGGPYQNACADGPLRDRGQHPRHDASHGQLGRLMHGHADVPPPACPDAEV